MDVAYDIQLIAELPGHDDRVWYLAWNPIEPILATCSADKTVRLYRYLVESPASAETKSVPKFEHFYTIPTGHAKTVRSIAWSPSGKSLATASFDSNIGIWEREPVGDEKEEEEGETPFWKREWECASLLEGHETECKSVAYSSTGTLLASCSRDKTVWVWEVHDDADFECMGVLMEHSQDVKCVSWHPNEEILASASYDDTIKLYIDDPSDDWYCFATLEGHTSTVWSLAWSPVGGYLASASDDKTIRIWRRVGEHKWECVLVIEGHDRTVFSLSWGIGRKETEDDSLGWLASAGGDGKINIWEIKGPTDMTNGTPPTYRLVASVKSAHGVHDVNSVAWCSRRGFENLIASAGDDGSAKVWEFCTRPSNLSVTA